MYCIEQYSVRSRVCVYMAISKIPHHYFESLVTINYSNLQFLVYLKPLIK